MLKYDGKLKHMLMNGRRGGNALFGAIHIDAFQENLETLGNYLSLSELKLMLQHQNKYGFTMLHVFCRFHTSENIEKICIIFKAHLESIELKRFLLKASHRSNQTALMIAARNSHDDVLQEMWTQWEYLYEDAELQDILLNESEKRFTILHYSVLSKNAETLNYAINLYEQKLGDEKMYELLVNCGEEGSFRDNILFHAIRQEDPDENMILIIWNHMLMSRHSSDENLKAILLENCENEQSFLQEIRKDKKIYEIFSAFIEKNF